MCITTVSHVSSLYHKVHRGSLCNDVSHVYHKIYRKVYHDTSRNTISHVYYYCIIRVAYCITRCIMVRHVILEHICITTVSHVYNIYHKVYQDPLSPIHISRLYFSLCVIVVTEGLSPNLPENSRNTWRLLWESI